MGQKFSKQLQALKPGDKVLVKYLKKINGKKNKGFGYVAYGEVTEKAEMAKDVIIGKKKLIDLSRPMNHHLNIKDKCEWVVRVKWLTHPLSAENRIHEKGLYYVRRWVVSKITDYKFIKTERILKKQGLIV